MSDATLEGSTPSGPPTPSARRRAHLALVTGDVAFRLVTGAFAAGILVLGVLILIELVRGAEPALGKFGLGFLGGRDWDPVRDSFGALPFLLGTLLTSAMALVIALPVSLGIAVLLAEYAPAWLRDPLSFLVELLAAIPSVVYGLWGLVVLVPFMRDHVNPAVEASPLGALPLFGKPVLGLTMLSASLVLAIMVVPIIAAMSRETLLAVPPAQREAALGLGLTKWETVRRVVIPYGRAGILSAAILGLGRALGETMAVTMLIGNTPQVTFDYFESGYTMSAVIANEFTEAVTDIHVASLVAIGLALFLLSFLVNAAARLLVRKMHHAGGADS